MSDVSRDDKIKILKDGGVNVTGPMESAMDNVIDIMYNTFIDKLKHDNIMKKYEDIKDNDKKTQKSKKDAKKESVTEESSEEESSESDNEKEVKSSKKKEDTTKKEEIILKILNHVLKTCKKAEITNIYDFKDINREDIIKCNHDIFATMEKEIVANFDKAKIGWYRYKTTNNYVLTWIKGACPQANAKFTYRRTHQNNELVTLYSVV
jgi:ABC-type proline/glycine betaine transport system ATPase subunit